MIFSSSRPNSRADALSAGSSTLPGPRGCYRPSRGEPRLVWRRSAAGAGPTPVSGKTAARLVLVPVFPPLPAPGQVPPGVSAGPGGRSRAVTPAPDRGSRRPLSSLDSSFPALLRPGPQPYCCPGDLFAVISSDRPPRPGVGVRSHSCPVTPRGFRSLPIGSACQGVFTFPGPHWKACSSCECVGGARG